MVEARCRAAEKAGALICAVPDDNGLSEVERVLLICSGTGGLRRGSCFAGRRRRVERPGRGSRSSGTGPGQGGRHWQDAARPALERLLRQGARCPASRGPTGWVVIHVSYELEGIDYPAGYVRWTERRNLACFLDLLVDGSVDVASLISGVHQVEEAADVYNRLGEGSLKGVGFLLAYGDPADAATFSRTLHVPPPAQAKSASPRRRSPSAVRLGFICKRETMPPPCCCRICGTAPQDNWRPSRRRNLCLGSTPNASSASRRSPRASNRCWTTTPSTPSSSLPEHHSHAGLLCQALERGLTVFVEKPLALTDEQLTAVLHTVEKTGGYRVMVGFNRRFAPFLVDLQERFGPSRGPVSARYLINAGRLDASSWYLNEELEGSRFTGEGGHFIDTLSALVGDHPVEAYAMGVGASVQASLRFADGSVATISYVTEGSARFPKETLDVVGTAAMGVWTISSGFRCGRPKARTGTESSLGRTKASEHNWSASSTPSEPSPRCRFRWIP